MKTLFICMLLILFVGWGCVPASMLSGEGERSELIFENKKSPKKGGRVTGVNDLEIFKVTVYPLVTQNSCVNCHGSSQSPKFAVADPIEAFNNLMSAGKVDLTDPESSRIVRKIADQSHNCWSNCADNADEMLAAVRQWARRSDNTDQGLGNIETFKKGFPDIFETQKAQTEYGTLILQAEQSSPGVLNGRYQTFIDSKALGQGYIKGEFPISNPITNTARVGSVQRARCSVPSYGVINNYTNGAYRIRETSTHVASDSRISAITGSTVKDGYTPFSYQLDGLLIRPDRRIERARSLISGAGLSIGGMVIANGNFPRITKRPGVLAPVVNGAIIPLSSGGFEILPHFAKWDEVFNSNGSFKARGNQFIKDNGDSEDVYNLFADGAYEPNPRVFLMN